MMGGSIFNLLGGGNQMPNNLFGNMMNMMTSFNQFRQSFQGDPKQQVQQLLDSGRMTQDQFNYLQQMASQFQNLLRR